MSAKDHPSRRGVTNVTLTNPPRPCFTGSMTTTHTTRFGKLRTASQHRFLLVACRADAQSPSGSGVHIVKRSNDPATLHKFASRDFTWDRDRNAWVQGSNPFDALASKWTRHAVVIDQTTGQEVAR